MIGPRRRGWGSRSSEDRSFVYSYVFIYLSFSRGSSAEDGKKLSSHHPISESRGLRHTLPTLADWDDEKKKKSSCYRGEVLSLPLFRAPLSSRVSPLFWPARISLFSASRSSPLLSTSRTSPLLSASRPSPFCACSLFPFRPTTNFKEKALKFKEKAFKQKQVMRYVLCNKTPPNNCELGSKLLCDIYSCFDVAKHAELAAHTQ